MRATFLALLVLLPCARAGHPISLSDTSWPNAGSTPPLLPSGMWLRWRANDLSSSPVSSWSDELQGWTWTQGSGGNQPTWDTNGVSFDGSSQFLTTSNLTTTTSLSGGTPAGQAWFIVAQYAAASGNHIALGALSGCSGGAFFYGVSGGQLFDASLGGTATITTNLFDFLACPVATNSYSAYTNGVDGFWTFASGWNDGQVVTRMGAPNGASACAFQGTIKEIIVWTNVIFTSAQVSNIHHYATNTYPITP